MRVKIPRWEIAVICSALLFPGTSLSAQEVGQEEAHPQFLGGNYL
ncbi:hypothetical protein PO183_27075 [Bacteroides ovatus]|nr:hypothetical protein [Bacteroides ovatus]MDC2369760.1 hypothetical protein [Bacteroides ovatus]